ncbi:prenyltransferase/squalene oxidase repeat-containing protein [Streptomyces sp. XD-27]|uniref:prenyltransferase/squalene oxidase repeat-containing protein n=1 Tax=Streptomyces sp. XD-27 TaxID=3062779 RepID=UPI0026F42599|nr:prenyltransferase/squalene oxidase repeat-containing protein [Streptomyces sp. XD-27]WKX70088.1 prenyltransferase/squalene oxidase repeat-containing protein [Streptomyces sp. XD-27]
MNVRRSAAALAVSVVLGAAAAPAAFADDAPSPKPKQSALPQGLYGTKDPTYDGVWRQSLALLAQDAVGVTPAESGVKWLAGQQCADGGFVPFRHETATPCTAKNVDSNATAAAVQALAAVGGHGAAVEKGVGWLKKNQNEDGGWGMNPGGDSDANSTAVAVGALAAAGQDPAKIASAKGGKTPYDALLALRLGCDAKKDERGAFAYQPGKGDLAPNDVATVAAALGATGQGFVFEPVGRDDDEAVEPLECGAGADKSDTKAKGAAAAEDAADAADAYLVAKLAGNGQHLMAALPGQDPKPDLGSTADAVLALAAGEHRAAAAKPLAWLQGKDSGAVAWAKDDPGALAKLILATRSVGGDPRDFGGTDLVRALNATGPKPAAASDHSGTQKQADEDKKKDDKGDSPFGLWWFIGVCAVAGIGIGFLLSGRKKQQL